MKLSQFIIDLSSLSSDVGAMIAMCVRDARAGAADNSEFSKARRTQLWRRIATRVAELDKVINTGSAEGAQESKKN